MDGPLRVGALQFLVSDFEYPTVYINSLVVGDSVKQQSDATCIKRSVTQYRQKCVKVTQNTSCHQHIHGQRVNLNQKPQYLNVLTDSGSGPSNMG